MGLLRRTFATRAPCSTILIRLVVGGTLLWAGIQDFHFVDESVVGRVAQLGTACPEIVAPLGGACEIVCGALLVLGLLTRLAAGCMVIGVSFAILPKVPLLLGHGFWIFDLPEANSYGFWSALREARMDLAMLLGELFLLIVGAGCLSLDFLLCEGCRPACPEIDLNDFPALHLVPGAAPPRSASPAAGGGHS